MRNEEKVRNEEKLLWSVLLDVILSTDYKYSPDEYTKMTTAKYSPNYVVAVVADIIENIRDDKESNDSNKSRNKIYITKLLIV
jgi:hypothetical protein